MKSAFEKMTGELAVKQNKTMEQLHQDIRDLIPEVFSELASHEKMKGFMREKTCPDVDLVMERLIIRFENEFPVFLS